MTGQETAFQQFTFGRVRPMQGKQLTEQQQIIYDAALPGLNARKISEQTGIRIGCVYDGLLKIRDRGWEI